MVIPVCRFIRSLESHNKLLRNYTQNIDTLEQVAGISNVIQCHGSFAAATCQRCGYKVAADAIKDDIFQQRIPMCPHCTPPTTPLPSLPSASEVAAALNASIASTGSNNNTQVDGSKTVTASSSTASSNTSSSSSEASNGITNVPSASCADSSLPKTNNTAPVHISCDSSKATGTTPTPPHLSPNSAHDINAASNGGDSPDLDADDSLELINLGEFSEHQRSIIFEF